MKPIKICITIRALKKLSHPELPRPIDFCMKILKPKDEVAVGVTIIAAFEVFFGLAGVCMLVSAVLDILGLPVPVGLITEIIIERIRASGLSGIALLGWSLIYLAVSAVGIGMFVHKEWARRLTLVCVPLAVIMLFPFFFPNYTITAKKLHILFLLGRAMQAKGMFLTYLLEVASAWWVFVIFFISLWVILQKYLSDPKIKKFFY